ncbi:hypothetical protein AgCh_034100 [Apium graveolens]
MSSALSLRSILDAHKLTGPNLAVCFHCNKLGHWKRNCKVYLAELKKKKGSKTTASDSGMFMIEVNMSLGQISTWVLNTTCDSHICNSLQGLKGSRTLEKDEVILRMGNGSRVAAISVGSFSLHMPTGKTIILNNCYYIPSIMRNIVSIPMLDVDGFSFIIKNNECSILRDNVLFGCGILNNGLLGHISENRLRTLHKEGLLDPFDFESYPTCESCLLGKMTKSPFSGHGEKAADLLGLAPEGVKLIGCKWVYKRKIGADGQVETYKARLVEKGFKQRQGIDFDETFSPVALLKSIRILLAIAAYYDYEIWQMDVKTAFLNGEVEEEVYMTQPEGFLSKGNEHLVYDILLIGNDIPMLQSVKVWLSKNFTIKDLGEASYILGMKIYRDRS